MGDRYSVLAVVFGVVSVTLGISGLPVEAQSIKTAGAAATTVESPAARTPWGVPDLQGIWDFRTITPLQRPDDLVDKTVFTPEEAAEYEAARVASLHKDQRVEDGLEPETDVAYAYNHFWWDYGDTLVEDRRTSLIVDPPDGRIPPLTPDGQARGDQRREARSRPAHGPEDRNVWERCIVGGNAGPPITPSAYNNNVQLLQAPGVVVIFNEMIHDARVVPIDGSAHLPDDIRQWRGDPRGRWEGETLVVESTNFNGKTAFRGSGADLRLEERFTRVSDGRLIYQFTIDDPTSFTKPWTAVIPMKATEGPIFEYACHEGNYGMVNLLAGARVQEAEAAALATREPQ